jgi:hypothetical protein
LGIFRSAGGKLNRLHQQLGSSPLILFFLGAAVLFLWVCATIIQVQTSEYLALGNPTRVAGVAWAVLAQPWLMITGQAPITDATAWLYAWVVEVITLVFALALTVAIYKLSDINHHLSRGFVIGGIALLILNSWADYSASPGSNPLVQFLIALAVGGMAVVGLPLGAGLIERGIEEL